MATRNFGAGSDEKNTLISLLDAIVSGETEMSSDEIISAINTLKAERKKAAKKETKKEKEDRISTEKELEKKIVEAHVKEVTSYDLPLDFENSFLGDERACSEIIDSIPDALVKCLNTLGRVDIEFIAMATQKDFKTVIKALKGSIYQNPETWGECFYKGWETSDQYLTGNMVRKWRVAKSANKEYKGYFSANVKAIEKLIPKEVSFEDIYITLGSPWVPTSVIDEFIAYLFRQPIRGLKEWDCVKHDEITGTWEIPNKSRYSYSAISYSTYGTKEVPCLHILEKTLNLKAVTVTKEVPCKTTKSGVKRVIDKAETLIAVEKQNLLIKTFQDWVWTNPKRKDKLLEIYEEKYSSIRTRTFDGSFLEFPNMSKDIELFDYQKNAVARILFSPNTLLSHDVGAGKTYILIAAGMEMRRMGLSKKNLYVVPNNIIEQWNSMFLTMYPSAKVFIVDHRNFTPSRRDETLRKIRNKDFDAIIMSHSTFDMIPLSQKVYLKALRDRLNEIKAISDQKLKLTNALKRERDNLQKEISELVNTIIVHSQSLYFDDLKIDRLFVDEAHNYKNVDVPTKIMRVSGFSKSGSKKCNDMMEKVHYIQKKNGGGGVVFATGTPITNSITDIYVMQKYLQSGELALMDIQNFDAWIGMFAERKSEFEIDVDTASYRMVTRFSEFHNLPELTSLLSSIADFHNVEHAIDFPEFNGYIDALIPKSSSLQSYLQDISKRADLIRNGQVSKEEDNMLKVTTDGRKAALDMRLVDDNAKFDFLSKVYRCAENVANIYEKTTPQKSTQLVFCDTSTPKAGFNVYDDLKQLLISMGVLGEEIAFVHDAKTEKQRKILFEKTRNGEIRVLIGSTFKLGMGVNVQDRLIAEHHLDIPWRPSDMVQREGRILRQGNKNKRVFIYRYITEGSFDAYSWQLLETKQRFIVDLLSGSMEQRSGSDVDETVLTYAEVKALAIGNPLIKERVETANELSRMISLQRKTMEEKFYLEQKLKHIPNEIKDYQVYLKNAEEDRAFYLENKIEYFKEEKVAMREKIFAELQDNVLIARETPLFDYNGFKIVLPANMISQKPYILLVRKGRYRVDVGDTDKGIMLRIDNYLDSLDKIVDKHKARIKELRANQKRIKEELEKNEGYQEIIENLKNRLKRIDKKLGVK